MLIESLQLYSPDVKSLKAFYKDVLGCSVVAEGRDYFEIEWGYSLLKFEEHPKATPYHFAINIPSNQIEAAVEWLRERHDILPGPDGDIVDFSSWRAKSVYFYDSDKNIVELIARERIAVNRDSSFDVTQTIGISEIGMPVSDINAVYKLLCRLAPFPVFSGSFDVFCAVGDDEGLFIVIDKHKKNWFPTDDETHSSEFKIRGREKGKSFSFGFHDGQIRS